MGIVDFRDQFGYNCTGKPYKKTVRKESYITITATEFKLHPGKYLLLAETEDLFISRNGKVTVKLVSCSQDKTAAMQSLFGCIPADITPEKTRDERLGKI